MVSRAIGRENRDSNRIGRSGEMAQQQQCRPIGPVQIVQHHQQRSRGRDLGQQAGDGLEQAIALDLRGDRLR